MHAQSCPTLCDPTDCSLTGSSVHGILQARILEWVAISFSRGSSWFRDWTHVSCISCFGRQVLYHFSARSQLQRAQCLSCSWSSPLTHRGLWVNICCVCIWEDTPVSSIQPKEQDKSSLSPSSTPSFPPQSAVAMNLTLFITTLHFLKLLCVFEIQYVFVCLKTYGLVFYIFDFL